MESSRCSLCPLHLDQHHGLAEERLVLSLALCGLRAVPFSLSQRVSKHFRSAERVSSPEWPLAQAEHRAVLFLLSPTFKLFDLKKRILHSCLPWQLCGSFPDLCLRCGTRALCLPCHSCPGWGAKGDLSGLRKVNIVSAPEPTSFRGAPTPALRAS